MSEWFKELIGNPGGVEFSIWKSAGLFLHATLVGLYLMFLNFWMSRKVSGASQKEDSEIFIASASVLFVCVGMTTVMILVNDNLARAFAIGAAISLIRFRVKMGGKFFGIALLYAVLTGMACGLGRADIAWTVAILFGLLLGSILKLHHWAARKNSLPEERPENRAA